MSLHPTRIHFGKSTYDRLPCVKKREQFWAKNGETCFGNTWAQQLWIDDQIKHVMTPPLPQPKHKLARKWSWQERYENALANNKGIGQHRIFVNGLRWAGVGFASIAFKKWGMEHPDPNAMLIVAVLASAIMLPISQYKVLSKAIRQSHLFHSKPESRLSDSVYTYKDLLDKRSAHELQRFNRLKKVLAKSETFQQRLAAARKETKS